MTSIPWSLRSASQRCTANSYSPRSSAVHLRNERRGRTRRKFLWAAYNGIFGEDGTAWPALLADAAEGVLKAGASQSILDRCVGAVPIGRLVFIADREALLMDGGGDSGALLRLIQACSTLEVSVSATTFEVEGLLRVKSALGQIPGGTSPDLTDANDAIARMPVGDSLRI